MTEGGRGMGRREKQVQGQGGGEDAEGGVRMRGEERVVRLLMHGGGGRGREEGQDA